MVVYASLWHLSESANPTHMVWITDFEPGATAPFAGIYRCKQCTMEIGIADGQTLPPLESHTHRNGTPVRWNLIVRTSKSN